MHQATSTAAAPGEGAKGHRRTPAGRGGDNGSAKAAEPRPPAEEPPEQRPAAARGRAPHLSKHGRGRSLHRGWAGTTKTQPPQRRRPPISAPRPIFGRFRPLSATFSLFLLVSRFSRLFRSCCRSARWRLLILWPLLICGSLCILLAWNYLRGRGGRLLGNGWRRGRPFAGPTTYPKWTPAEVAGMD